MFYDYPLEIQLKMADYLSFSDLWYLACASHSCRAASHWMIREKYHIELICRNDTAFDYLVHAAVAHVNRYGYDSAGTIEQETMQNVANRLAVELYCRSPSSHWNAYAQHMLDTALDVLIDHVLLDSQDPLPVEDSSTTSPCIGQLIAEFLACWYPVLTTLFECETDDIHRRPLMLHLNRRIDTLTLRYRHAMHHTHSKTASHDQEKSVRHGLRLLIRFLGMLVQANLLSVSDLHAITHDRIITFFSTQGTAHSLEWIHEIDFQISILLDLMRAVVHRRPHAQSSDAEGLHMVAAMLSKTATDLSRLFNT